MENLKRLIEIKKANDNQSRTIQRLIDEAKEVKKTIEDIKFLKLYSGDKMLTGTSGKIGEEDIFLRKVKLSTLSACVSIPDLLLGLAKVKLVDIDKRALDIINSI